LFDRPKRGERALLLHARIGRSPFAEEKQEFEALADSAGAEVVGHLDAHLRSVNARYLIGKGKMEELSQLAESTCAELILVDHLLSPAQERNLEQSLKLPIVSRTGLILDIFALRARTFEGKLQVELAQLQHLSTRLIRGWTHLERQKGGIGLRGPGETQLESDRRILATRIKQLDTRLEKLSSRRNLARSNRRKREIPTISLVGYTNTGKSTLFNQLTDAGVTVADQLFATMDPTLRAMELPNGNSVVLADTVGFVRELPHELIAAFQSTLEEIRDAHLLLHVVDCSDPVHQQRIEEVQMVLEEIGADHVSTIQVYNKADILAVSPRVDRAESGKATRVWLSARTGTGIDELLKVIAEHQELDTVRGTVQLGVSQGRLRALLYDTAHVVGEQVLENGGWELEVEMNSRDYEVLHRDENFRLV